MKLLQTTKLLLVISVVISTYCGKFQKEIFIPRTLIQDTLEKKFPYDKSAIFARLTLSEPFSYFVDTCIGIKLKYRGTFLDKEINGNLDLKGSIKYEKGKFYLENFEIVELTMDEKEFDSKGKLQKIIFNMINNYFECFPVYTLKQTDFKQNIAKMLLKNITVNGDSLCVLIGI